MNCQNCLGLGVGFDDSLGLGLGFDDRLGLGFDFMIFQHCCLGLCFDHQFLYLDMSQNQNQNQVQLNKKEGDDKKKAKSHMTWHIIECDGSVKKRIRRCWCTISPG